MHGADGIENMETFAFTVPVITLAQGGWVLIQASKFCNIAGVLFPESLP